MFEDGDGGEAAEGIVVVEGVGVGSEGAVFTAGDRIVLVEDGAFGRGDEAEAAVGVESRGCGVRYRYRPLIPQGLRILNLTEDAIFYNVVNIGTFVTFQPRENLRKHFELTKLYCPLFEQ